MPMKQTCIYSNRDYLRNKWLCLKVFKMSNNQYMPDRYSTSTLLHGLDDSSLGALSVFKNISNQYLNTFLLAFFLKNNEDDSAPSVIAAFETYFNNASRLNASEFLSTLEQSSKYLLGLIRNQLLVLLKNKQTDRVRQKFQDLDLYEQINTNMIDALVTAKAKSKAKGNKLSGFEIVSNNDFVGRFFWLNLQSEMSEKSLNEQVVDNFGIKSVRTLVLDCVRAVKNNHQNFLLHIDNLFKKQIEKNPTLFDALTIDSAKNVDLSENLDLVLFFLVGQTVLICLDLMLNNPIPQTNLDAGTPAEDLNADSLNTLMLNISRGLLAIGAIGCLVGLIPKK